MDLSRFASFVMLCGLALMAYAQEAEDFLHSARLPLMKEAPTALHVDGNKLLDSDGKAVWLQGVCLDSLQWSGGGEHLMESVPVAIEQWHANVIRLPITDEFWAGRNKWQHDKGKRYRELVDRIVHEVNRRGAYVLLDLHRFKKPENVHAEFWQDVATRYGNQPGILFELFNEPHSISWEEWRSAMQKLLETVRCAGANNVVVAGGLNWGYDLSRIASGEHLLEESHEGRGIVYSSHVYPWKNDWEKNFLKAAERVPLFIGEVGNPRSWDDFSFIAPSARSEKVGVESTWPMEVLGVIQEHRLHWTGFSFHPKCAPQLLVDWNYVPTPYWGVHVKAALGGKVFKGKLH